MKSGKNKNKFYVTTPIYYGTAKPHLGSLYSTLIADVASRWNKLQGKDVFFLTGTDEHGQKIAQAAAKAGMDPKKFVDQFIPDYKRIWKDYEIDYSIFMRTTADYHIKAVQLWLQQLIAKGYIYKDFYTGYYCISCETYVTEAEVENPLCPSCGRATQLISEESYFFKLSAFQEKLLTFYEQNPLFIIPKERAHEVINFVKAGLKDLSISRTTLTWGIPFPGDSKHVTYVWADALNNYITAIGYGQEGKEKEFSSWWPADLQVMGKDIIRFHAIYWPAFLMASDLPLPKHLLVHGWIKVDAQKMSKSLGNVVDPEQLYKTYGADPIRYYLMREMSFAQDTDFSFTSLEQRITSDLANDLGNLLNRTLTLALQHESTLIKHPSTWSEKSLALHTAAKTMIQNVQNLMESYTYHLAIAEIWRFIHQVNAYFHEAKPWVLAKTDKAAFNEILSAVCHSLHTIGFILWPVMPQKMELLLKSLGITFTLQNNDLEQFKQASWQSTFTLTQCEPLFQKFDTNAPAQEKNMEEKQNSAHITIDDVAKVKLMVGTIIDAEIVPSSSKLLKMNVDFGPHGKRQILAGIRTHYTPEDIKGKQGVFIVNLKPRMMMGLESQGMMLIAHDANGKLQLLSGHNPVTPGSSIS